MGIGNWLRRLFGGTPRMRTQEVSRAPEGWTDDLSISLPPGRTIEEVVDFVLSADERTQDHAEVLDGLGVEFGLSIDDAELVVDRVAGGVFRARTRSPDNCPDRVKDPIAWTSFHRTVARRNDA